MRQATHRLALETFGKGFTEITRQVTRWLEGEAAGTGVLTLFCRHTSCSLLIQENADPTVRTDLIEWFEQIAPESGQYVHEAEGADDMPAHIQSALTATSLSIPVTDGELALGTWQGIYIFEHRRAPHRREIVLHFIGD